MSVSGIATPEVILQVEDGEYEHLKVSSTSVAEYFKEKMRLTVSKPSGSETEADEVSRGGIGSRLKSCGHDGTGEVGGLRGGLGMRLLTKMSVTEAGTETSVQEETPEGKGKEGEDRGKRKHRSEDTKGEASHKPKRGYKKAQKVSD